MPRVKLVCDSNTGHEVRPDTIHQLVPYLRLAYCRSVCVDLRIWGMTKKYSEGAYGALFGDLVVPSALTNVLTFYPNYDGAVGALRKFGCYATERRMGSLVL